MQNIELPNSINMLIKTNDCVFIVSRVDGDALPPQSMPPYILQTHVFNICMSMYIHIPQLPSRFITLRERDSKRFVPYIHSSQMRIQFLYIVVSEKFRGELLAGVVVANGQTNALQMPEQSNDRSFWAVVASPSSLCQIIPILILTSVALARKVCAV